MTRRSWDNVFIIEYEKEGEDQKQLMSEIKKISPTIVEFYNNLKEIK